MKKENNFKKTIRKKLREIGSVKEMKRFYLNENPNQYLLYSKRRINFEEDYLFKLLKRFAFDAVGKPPYKLEPAFRLLAAELLDPDDPYFITNRTTLEFFLKEKFFEKIDTYLKDIYNESGNEQGYKYVLIKHSERYGKSNGFSESFRTWNMLLNRYGYWFLSMNWKKLKNKFDDSDKNMEILISKPGDEDNETGYYFTIQKIKISK